MFILYRSKNSLSEYFPVLFTNFACSLAERHNSFISCENAPISTKYPGDKPPARPTVKPPTAPTGPPTEVPIFVPAIPVAIGKTEFTD